MIIIRFQLVVQGRAKIIQSSDRPKKPYGSIQSRDCIGLFKDFVWSNKPSLWVMNCLFIVERLWAGNKLSIVVQGRSLRARLFILFVIFSYVQFIGEINSVLSPISSI